MFFSPYLICEKNSERVSVTIEPATIADLQKQAVTLLCRLMTNWLIRNCCLISASSSASIIIP